MPEPLWTSAEIAAATRGSVFGGGFEASGVSFDTRTIEPGEELSYDYGEEYFEIHLAGSCRCAKCSP